MDRLRKRRDFLAAARAERAGVATFLLQGRDRGDAGEVRVGLTVTKKTGNAVVRNRIRRRLREAVRRILPAGGQAGFDYVLVAREAALRAPFDDLVSDLARAVRRIHAPERSAKPAGRARASGAKAHDSPGPVQDSLAPAPGAPAKPEFRSKMNAPADGGSEA